MKFDTYSKYHGKIDLRKIVPEHVPLWEEKVKKIGITRVRGHVRASRMEVLNLFSGQMEPRVKPLPKEFKNIMEISCRAPECPYCFNIDPFESGGCYNCFVAGTPILMYDNTEKPVEKMRVGDEVVSFDEKKKELTKGEVVATSKRDSPVVKVSFKNGKFLICTPEHPFYTRQGWVEASKLVRGDKVFELDAWIRENRSRMLTNNPM